MKLIAIKSSGYVKKGNFYSLCGVLHASNKMVLTGVRGLYDCEEIFGVTKEELINKIKGEK